ncbi:ATP-binding protein [Roseivirga sp.]|uniref:ATP-binding protein n=1 Tax=Roseivirga sp. TaxID=1964215 RepID=UPI002B265AB4|nr:ATP-binding protein [Roseivirga sp.]
MIKVAIIGPESTGKTTLTKVLADQYNTVWVPEYARDYLNQLDRPYVQSDLLEIAKGQIDSQKLKKKAARELLFCDTDLHVIKVWSEHKYGTCDPWILNQLKVQYYDLYILTFFDVPYEDDPLRENPEMRPHFFDIYHNLMKDNDKAFIVAQGDLQTRLEQAKKAIGALL